MTATCLVDVWMQHEVMFGTNRPMITPQRALRDLDSLGLDGGVRRRFLAENARSVFRLA